jgi:hypothetical protein
MSRRALIQLGAQPSKLRLARPTRYAAARHTWIVLAVILGACPLCCQPVTLDRLAAALAGT